jgi:hypothetical protein
MKGNILARSLILNRTALPGAHLRVGTLVKQACPLQVLDPPAQLLGDLLGHQRVLTSEAPLRCQASKAQVALDPAWPAIRHRAQVCVTPPHAIHLADRCTLLRLHIVMCVRTRK